MGSSYCAPCERHRRVDLPVAMSTLSRNGCAPVGLSPSPVVKNAPRSADSFATIVPCAVVVITGEPGSLYASSALRSNSKRGAAPGVDGLKIHVFV